MKAADYVARRLARWGLDTCFTVTGGAAMHLNDAFGEEPAITVRYLHHEQACAIAAEGYARVAGRPAVVNVTAGPGAINALNGVFGAFTDSVPMVVVSGQSRRDTLAPLAGVPQLRQLGDQEARVSEIVRPLAKAVWLATDAGDVPDLLDVAVVTAVSGRPGPTWLDIPVDVQGSEVDADPDAPLPPLPQPVSVGPEVAEQVLDLVSQARRPVILAGTGIRASGTLEQFRTLVDLLGIPVTTAWTHDLLPDGHPLHAGRPGTIGTRAGNFAVQSCDLLVVLGSRLNIRQVSYNWPSFAAEATVVWVDIDPAELAKPFVKADVPVVADLRAFIPALIEEAGRRGWAPQHDRWVAFCRELRLRFEPRVEDYREGQDGINAYHLVPAIFSLLGERDVVVCGDATACIVPFQTGRLHDGARMFSNSGCASMGYDLPAALGAAAADPSRRVVCLAGDGSLMMNLQELQTLAASAADLLLVVLDNDGYLSIKQTQRNFFGREHGASPASGVSFPDFSRVCGSFGMPVTTLDASSDWMGALAEAMAATGPRVCVARLDREQEFEPRLRSRMVDGTIVTPALDDMYPHLSDEMLASVRAAAHEI